jgi:hypothetical protein
MTGSFYLAQDLLRRETKLVTQKIGGSAALGHIDMFMKFQNIEVESGWFIRHAITASYFII